MIGAIAGREAAALFRAPTAWVLLAAVQTLVAFVFLLHLDHYLQLQPRMSGSGPGVTAFLVPRLFSPAATIQLLALPLITMNLIAGERRQGTLALLLSAPATTLEIILGKFLGLLAVLVPMVALTALMPLSLAGLTPIDTGALALASLGGLLFAMAAAAFGLYLSTLARQPLLAALGTIAGLLALVLLGEWGRGAVGGGWGELLAYPAPTTHLQPFLGGLFDSGALVYFGLFIGLFLTLATRRLDNERLQR